jgi:hypothetical protein
VAAIFGGFFIAALFHPAATIPLLIKATLGVIVWEIAIHVALAARKAPEPTDGKDRRIGQAAIRVSLTVLLCAGAAIALAQAIVPRLLSGLPLFGGIPQRMLLIDLVAFALTAAEIAKSITTIVLYRISAAQPAQL